MIIAGPEQSIISIATLEHGVGYAFALALRNNISVTDVILAGQPLEKPKFIKENYLSFEQLLIEKPSAVLPAVIAHPNQSFVDIANQEDGSPFSAFERAVANGMNITDPLTPGYITKSIVPTLKNEITAKQFKNLGIKIATSIFTQQPTEPTYLDYLFPGEFPYSF